MNTQLLATKLSLPSPRSKVVARAHLVERLSADLFQDGSMGRPLTLVSAPAGYGKTTLVVEWVKSVGLPVAWLSLDEADNDPNRFLRYLIAGLTGVDDRIGGAAAAMLASPQMPPVEVILTSLLNDITTAFQPFILVLDDYHVIHSPSIHQHITFLLEHAPEQMHLVITTREDPLLPVPRLRARGQVLEIRQDELRFSAVETEKFLQEVMGLDVSADQIGALERRTEGWIAGLQLAALSMRGREDVSSFVEAFAGSSRFILDYLIEEVFERQPPEVRDFLLKTSILERLSGPLCDAVVETTGGQQLLEALEQANTFIVPLDQTRGWYRYHRLFGELLRHRLRTSSFDESGLHRKASQWYEEQDFQADAIHHALSGSDWERAARLIGGSAEEALKRGELVTLIGWYQQVPEQIIRGQPEFGMSYAWALLLSGRFDQAEELLTHFEAAGRSMPLLLGQVANAQAYAARARGDNQRVIEKSEQALRLLPESDETSRSVLSLNLGLVYWHEGRLREAVPALEDAYELGTRVDNLYGSLSARIFLARTLASQGALRQAEEMLQETLRAGGEIPILVLAYYDLAGIYYEWNDLGKAESYLEQGLEMSTRSGNLEFQNAGHVQKACLLMARGNMADALAEAETSHALSRDYGAVTQARSMACHAQVALAKGEVQTARHWVEQMPVDVDVNSFYRFLGLMKARLALEQGDRRGARELLEGCLARATQAEWGYAVVAIRALLAQAVEQEGAALEVLVEGLRQSQPEGFVRSYVDAGTGLVPLLQTLARRPTHFAPHPGGWATHGALREGEMAEYIAQILRAYGETTQATLPLVEPLSERELEVLKLLTAGYSNREIAETLVISTGTAKTHVHNLCGKLGVRNRTEAAMKAKELGLV